MLRRSVFSMLAGMVVLAASATSQAQIVIDIPIDPSPTFLNFGGFGPAFVATPFRTNAVAGPAWQEVGAYLRGTGFAQMAIYADSGNPAGSPVAVPFYTSPVFAVAGQALYNQAINFVAAPNTIFWFAVAGTTGIGGVQYSVNSTPGTWNTTGANAIFGAVYTTPGIWGANAAGGPWGQISNTSAVSFRITQIPEPSTFVLGGVVIAAAGFMGWKRRRDLRKAQARLATAA